jgi:glutathione S-transferase
MITLFSAGAGFDLPEVSPYCMKTEVQLQMAGLAYRKEGASPEASPKGQLPFIDDGELIADSTFIRVHIEQKYGFDFDAGLSPVERARAWAIERMIENHFAWTTLPGRFLVKENFAKGPARWFDGAPEDMRAGLREDLLDEIRRRLWSVGVTRHSEQENIDLGVRSLVALAALLGDRPHLLGDRIAGVDATAFGVLANLMTPFFDTPLGREALSFPNLVAYVGRMMRRFYPGHPWTVGAAEPQRQGGSLRDLRKAATAM